jgi:hypothetical protein
LAAGIEKSLIPPDPSEREGGERISIVSHTSSKDFPERSRVRATRLMV